MMPVILVREKEGDHRSPIQVVIVEPHSVVLKNPSAQGPDHILSIAGKLSEEAQAQLAGGFIEVIRQDNGKRQVFKPPEKMMVTSGSKSRGQ